QDLRNERRRAGRVRGCLHGSSQVSERIRSPQAASACARPPPVQGAREADGLREDIRDSLGRRRRTANLDGGCAAAEDRSAQCGRAGSSRDSLRHDAVADDAPPVVRVLNITNKEWIEMLKSVQMPKLGVTMDDGTILEWNKAVGDSVAIGDLLLTIETDKAATEYESTDSGILHEILAKPGEVIPVGQVICVLREA